MKALLKKELTEVLVPFGFGFLVISMCWLASVRFWEALLPPAAAMLMVVAVSSALAGAVLGYLQFSVERWRGKLGYLVHRGTGVEGAFLAKTIAGLIATALIGLGPPLLYGLCASLFSPNASIIQWSFLPAYASAASVGASLYVLGALAASLRRRAVVGILLIPLGIGGLWMISEMIGTPWGNATSEWPFVALHLGLGAALLILLLRLTRSGVDANLPLPRGIQLAILALIVPLVLYPCDVGSSILQSSLLSEARSDYPVLVRDRETGEIFTVLHGEDGGYFRTGPGAQLGERIELSATADPERGVDTVFWGNGLSGETTSEPPSAPSAWVRQRMFATRRGLTPLWRQQATYLRDRVVADDSPPFVQVFLDRERGTVRAFGVLSESRRQFQADGIRRAPFAIELRKPQRGQSFSPAVVVLDGQGDAVGRLLEGSTSADPAQPRPRVKLLNCLVDPEDGSSWRLDVLDPNESLTRVELPGGDRFVRLESLYYRNELVFGRYQDTWEDPVVVGEKGRYAWNGREFVEFNSSERYATASDAASLQRFRVVIDDPDPLRWTVRVLDVKDDHELFTYAYAPRSRASGFVAATTQATVLLRSPLVNTLVFSGSIPRRYDDPTIQVRSEILLDGRRPWLWALDLAVGVGCAAVCARMLRRRGASASWIGVGAVFVLLFGPVALLVAWLLEPKGRAREVSYPQAVHEPALAIQSA